MRLATAVAAALMLALGGASADARPAPATPQLIESAVERGKIGPARGHLLQAYAIAAPDRLPPAYRSSTPWDGTTELLELSRALEKMPPGPTAREIEALVEPAATGATCSSSSSSLPSSTSTAHFYVEYGTIAAASDLDVADYTASLETAWATEVDSFGWAAPPVAPAPAPGSKYHVRIDALSPGLYGFVSPAGTHAGVVGNNPNTAWSDGDAYASCMVLNRDYSGFDPSSPQQALDSTTAHEFNHSLQFGYGALAGANTPDDVFVEGGATWVEDEVFDNANDNYLYLWPVFADGMGDYDNSPYPYWITFRGLTERFGTGVAGAGEDVMQRFWELTSKNEASNLGALDSALVAEGTTLADAFHAYAIAVKFKKPCGGAHVLPYCFEEAVAYPSNTAAAANWATIASVGGSAAGIRLEDHYAIKWIGLPTAGGPYSVTLENISSAGGPGRLRGTAVCDTGSALTRHPLPSVVADGGSATVTPIDPSGCSSVVLAVTNQTKTADNPGTSPTRRFNVKTAAAVSSYPLTVAKSGDGSGTVTSTPAGIDCGSTCAADFAPGTSVTLTAAATAGSTFTGWSGACSGTGACVVSMTQARSVTATFQAPRTLSVTKSGDGSGTITSSPAGISCGATCEAQFAHGTSVTLTAAAATGSTFTGWTGACGGTGQCVVSMTQARSVTATFEAQTPLLSVTKSGDGSGTVTSTPEGVDCGSTCSAEFAYATVVMLTATPEAGSTFTGWSGACTGTGTCQVAMTEARAVTATFQPMRSLSVTRLGDGSGTVTSDPEGIDCGSTCSAQFTHATSVTVTATASPGSTFTGWGGACSGTGPCVVSMTQARSVTATFEGPRSLSVAKSGDGSGTVTSSPAGIDCGSTCSADFAHGASVTLTAAAAPGSTFTGWTGACSGTGQCVVSMTQARSATATFEAQTPLLSVTNSGDGTGSVTSSPEGIDCGATCSAPFAYSADVTLTAVAAPGSTFTGWSGACAGTGSCQVTMTEARAVTAEFQAERSLSVSKGGDGSGTVTSAPSGIDCGVTCSAPFVHGTVVTLTPTATDGSTFAGWSGACAGTGTCQVTMTEARNVTANFAGPTPSTPPPSEPEPEPDPAPTVFDPAPSEPEGEVPGRDPAPAPSPLTPVLDTVPPQISFLSGKRIRATKTGRITLRLGCAASETPGCSGRVRLFLLRRTPLRVGRKSFDIAPGRSGRVVIRLARIARRQLARTGRIRIRAVVRAVDAAGNVTELRRTLTVRPAR